MFIQSKKRRFKLRTRALFTMIKAPVWKPKRLFYFYKHSLLVPVFIDVMRFREQMGFLPTFDFTFRAFECEAK